MNSATDIWEGGLGSSSGELGHNIADHHLEWEVSGMVEVRKISTPMVGGPMGFIFHVTRTFLATSVITCGVLATRVVAHDKGLAAQPKKYQLGWI